MLVATSRRYVTTSTIVIGSDATALVVDPNWDADELQGVAQVVRDAGAACVAGLATHVHYDHVLWHPDLPDVPRWATPWTVETWQTRRDEGLAPLIGDFPEELLTYVGRLTALPVTPRPEPYPLPWTSREVILHEHDAHARCHVAAEITDSSVLLAGDMLSDVELPMPDEDDPGLVRYLEGLDRLADVVRRTRMLVPGHGSPTDRPMERLDADRRYIDAVIGGRPVDDARLGNDGMAELHEANVRQARLAGS